MAPPQSVGGAITSASPDLPPAPKPAAVNGDWAVVMAPPTVDYLPTVWQLTLGCVGKMADHFGGCTNRDI